VSLHVKFTDKNFKQPIVFYWACMPTVYCYPVKLTIADLIRVKSICSQTQFSHIINRLLTSFVRSVLWNIRPLFFAWTSLLRRSVHTEKTSVWYFTVQTSRSVNKPLLSGSVVGSSFWLGGGGLKARAKGPRKFLNLESLKCHLLDCGEDLTEFWWSENSVLVCRNLQFSSTKWAKAYLINSMLDKLQESMGNIFIFFAVCHGHGFPAGRGLYLCWELEGEETSA
jgi:hypothetical protein